jgi:hypothetical protein
MHLLIDHAMNISAIEITQTDVSDSTACRRDAPADLHPALRDLILHLENRLQKGKLNCAHTRVPCGRLRTSNSCCSFRETAILGVKLYRK